MIQKRLRCIFNFFSTPVVFGDAENNAVPLFRKYPFTATTHVSSCLNGNGVDIRVELCAPFTNSANTVYEITVA